MQALAGGWVIVSPRVWIIPGTSGTVFDTRADAHLGGEASNGQDAHSSAVAPQHGRGRRRRVRGNAGHTVRGVCAAEFQPVHRYRLGVAGVRRHGQRSPVDPPGDRSVGPPPLVPGAVAGTPDRDRDVAPGQRGQGRAALRIHPDSRPDELHVLDAQRLTGIPVLPARIGRRVQPHHDVPGDGQPCRRGRSGAATAAAVGFTAGSAGGRTIAGGLLHRRARWGGAHRPHAKERVARRQVAASDHGTSDVHSRGRGSAAHLVRPRVLA
ncbi:Uncharacterised protein [Mycobacterium tuberculosis]|nr:Uncharacterised protein [Mycobacterium tuberculosis]